MYENLHRELLNAIGRARDAGLPDVVVAIQNAIGAMGHLQDDSEVLYKLLAKAQSKPVRVFR